MKRLFVLGSMLVIPLLLWTQTVRAQVSDTQAYFQWMLAVTDDTLTPRMAAHLNAAGLQGVERERVAVILSKFKAEELALEASTDDATTDVFIAQQDALTQRTVEQLKAILSPSSLTVLDNRVEHEAKNIKVNRVSAVHQHSMLTPVSYGRPQRLGMTPNYTYYNTSAVGVNTFPLTTSMLVQQGLPQWNAANLIDGNTADVGFSTSNAVAWNGEVVVNFGSAGPQDITSIGLYMSAANTNAVFDILYWDPGDTNWVLAHNGWTPVYAGWNYTSWPDTGAHQQWIVQLANSPGPGGPTINEMQFIAANATVTLYTTSQVTGTTSCPDGCPPLAKHVGWAQVVTPDGVVHNTYGPGVYPTSNINVSDNESTVLPGDGGNNPPSTTSTTGGVNCTVAGNGFSGTPNVEMDIRFERAITESYISALLDSNGMHPEHIYCIIAATPPDFPGPDEALPGTPSGQVVNMAFMYREWPLGTSETGVPWQLVFPKIQRVGVGYYVPITMEPDPSGCTMWDNGFRHLPLPTPLDPQPSSPW